MLGSYLRDLRRRARLTGAEVGAKIGRPQSSVSRWENGHGTPPVVDLVLYFDAVGASDEDRLTALRLAGTDEQVPHAHTPRHGGMTLDDGALVRGAA